MADSGFVLNRPAINTNLLALAKSELVGGYVRVMIVAEIAGVIVRIRSALNERDNVIYNVRLANNTFGHAVFA